MGSGGTGLISGLREAAQAPAKQVGEIARAFQEEAASATGQIASKVHKNHGERDCHRIFQRYGLTLKVPICELTVPLAEGEPLKIPHLKISDFLSKLLQSHPRVLFGGLDPSTERAQAEEMCFQFWKRFQGYQPDHAVYEKYSEQDWKYILPVCIHADKGRGIQKKPFFCFSWEVCFGLPKDVRLRSKTGPADVDAKLSWTCKKRKREQSLDLDEAADLGDACSVGRGSNSADAVNIPHNGRGNTFLSRFMCTAVPHKVLLQSDDIVPTILNHIADDLTTLFLEGLQHGDYKYHLALVGCKGARMVLFVR